jgi:hypothetical protein
MPKSIVPPPPIEKLLTKSKSSCGLSLATKIKDRIHIKRLDTARKSTDIEFQLKS